MAIAGVPAPEKIQYKEAKAQGEADEPSSQGVVDKVAEVASEASEAAKTIVADTDGGVHEEL